MRLKPWQFLLLLACVLALLAYGLSRFTHRLVGESADIVRLLPDRSGATTFYVNVGLLRTTHLLDLLSPEKVQAADYRSFVDATGFDYTRDLDAVAGSRTAEENDFILQGRFDWTRIQNYARTQGGTCDAICTVPASTPGRWASFRMLQSDVIALAVSSAKTAAERLGTPSQQHAVIPAGPLWVKLPGSALNQTSGWPMPAQLLAASLHGAQSVSFAAGPHDTGLRLEMRARYDSEQAAHLVKNQLEIDTRMLKLELTHEHQKPNPADLTGLLTAGTFQEVGPEVVGDWPVDLRLLQALEID